MKTLQGELYGTGGGEGERARGLCESMGSRGRRNPRLGWVIVEVEFSRRLLWERTLVHLVLVGKVLMVVGVGWIAGRNSVETKD